MVWMLTTPDRDPLRTDRFNPRARADGTIRRISGEYSRDFSANAVIRRAFPTLARRGQSIPVRERKTVDRELAEVLA